MSNITILRVTELQQQAEFMAQQAAKAAEAVQELQSLEQQQAEELAPLTEAFEKLKTELDELKKNHQTQLEQFVAAHPELRGVKVAQTNGAKVQRREGLTCKSIILAGLDAGKAPKDIVEEVRSAFPDSKCTVKDIYWHRGQLKKLSA